MYPYKKFELEINELTYNYDDTIENDIYITVDKMVHNTLLNKDKRLIDILYNENINNSVELQDTIDKIIINCLMVNEYNHITILSEYYATIIKGY